MTRTLLAAINVAPVADAALLYAGAGWPVFPLHHPMAGGCSCRRTGCDRPAKHPRTTHGLKDGTIDANQVKAWWARWPEANIGLVTGPAAGVFVVDLDPASGGFDSWTALCAANGEPETLRARIGSGGLHVFFCYPAGEDLRNKQALRPGVDVRGEGGYVVAAPSQHITGGRYQWML